MPDLIKLEQQKDKILSFIRLKGPSLPVQIAENLKISPLFAGAFLSELYKEKKIKISNIRVGSSPLYYIEGQESLLANFIQYLQTREREAFYLLQKEKVLEDSAQTPVVRVALREIKDFAVPVKARSDENIFLFWRHFLVSEDNTKQIIQQLFGQSQAQPSQEISKKENPAEEIKKEEKSTMSSQTESLAKVIVHEHALDKEIPHKEEEKFPEKKKKTKNVEESEFVSKVKEHLGIKDIELLEVLLEKKNEMTAKVRVESLFGKQKFYMLAKDKKSVTDNDLIAAMQNAQIEKMPVLFVSRGKLAKKAENYLKDWGNLIKFEKI